MSKSIARPTFLTQQNTRVRQTLLLLWANRGTVENKLEQAAVAKKINTVSLTPYLTPYYDTVSYRRVQYDLGISSL